MRTRTLIYAALAVGAAILLSKRAKAAKKKQMRPSKPAAPVKNGEQLSAETYTIIRARKKGMTYAPVTKKTGKLIEFRSPKAGFFTRNVLSENGKLYAEIK